MFHGVLPTLLFCPNNITNVYCNESFAWFRPLASATGTPLSYPVVALWHGAPVALCLQGRHLHMFKQFLYLYGADVGVGQLKALDLSFGGNS